MANVLGELFQDIADAIRSKTGSTDTLKPNQFPEAIEGITTGGGSSADVRYVTFMNGTEVLYKKPVAVGDDCVDVLQKGLIETPTKESTAQYDYTFYGWGASDGGAADANILKNIRADKTVYAIFTATVRMYTITWLDEDGTELPGQKQWAYGTIPNYTPVKDGKAFGGWNPEPVPVTGNATYTAIWASTIGSGTLSYGVNWVLLANGTLTISGETAMQDYTDPTSTSSLSTKKTAIYPYRDQIKNVIFEGVTNIAANLFYEYPVLESVTIPDSVTRIGASAFYSCALLTRVSIGNSVTSIGVYAFSKTGLTSIIIPNSVTSMDNYVLWQCPNLTSVTLGNSVVSLGSNMFKECAKLTSITIPNSVTSIGSMSFVSCTSLASAIFENPSGWSAGATALSETELADTATAATYLVKTYAYSNWKRS